MPALSLVIAAASVSEADGPAATTATVNRNGDTASPLTVNLSSNDTSEASVPVSVQIPAGLASAAFDIAAVDDAIVDGTQTVTVTASAVGYADGNDTPDVTDDDGMCYLGPMQIGPAVLTGTETYQSEVALSTTGSVIVSGGADILFEAPDSIGLNPGFIVEIGALFEARINPVICL